MRTTLIVASLVAGLAVPANAQTPLSPCEAYGAAKAVFIGEAGAPAVYYPGVASRKDAEVIVIGRGETRDIGDFYVPNRD